MGLFGKLFSKKTDPELERLAQSLELLEHALAESKKPQGPQGLAKSAIKGAETRRWLFELLEEFEAEKGGIGAGVAADGMFYHPQLIEWFRSRYGLSESEPFLQSLLAVVFPTADRKRRIDENWPTIVTTYQGKPNTNDILLDKAGKLTDYIILHLGIATDLYGMFIEVFPDQFKERHEINDQLQELVKLEELALWFRMLNELANRFIRRECPLFMHYLEDALGDHLAMQGALPEAVINIVGTRIDEYASYQKFIAEPEEFLGWHGNMGGRETSYGGVWLRPDAIFQTRFVSMFLETAKEALVGELLTGI